jgi:predicted RNA polymerase sigma factor
VVRGLAGFRGDEAAWRAWLFTTARRRAIDRLRRERVGREKLARLAALEAVPAGTTEDEPMSAIDDRLGLMFACCHPALGLEARIALTLNALGGLPVIGMDGSTVRRSETTMSAARESWIFTRRMMGVGCGKL